MVKIVNSLLDFEAVLNIVSQKKLLNPYNVSLLQRNCRENYSQNITIEPMGEREKKAERTEREIKYKKYIEKLKQGEIDDQSLKDFSLFLASQVGIICLETENGKRIYTETKCRGSARYAKAQQAKVRDWCTFLGCGEWETVALTITYDMKTFGENRYLAWKNYKEQMAIVSEHLRRNYDAMYCAVVESTKKGYPHAHIVMAFPKGTIENYENLENRCNIRTGKIFNVIQKHVMSRIFHLEKISGESTKHYLSKYITKNSKAEFRELAQKKGKLKNADRKELLGILALCCTGIRQVQMTQARTIKKRGQNMPEDIKNLLEEYITEKKEILQQEVGLEKLEEINDVTFCKKDLPEEPTEELREWASRKRHDLIKRCIKSVDNCPANVRLAKRMVWAENEGRDFREFDNAPREFHEKFKKNSIQLGCSGCLFSDLRKIISGIFPETVQKFYWEKDGTPKELFNMEVYNDDYQFIRHLNLWAMWIVKEMCLNDKMYSQIIKDEFINEKPFASNKMDFDERYSLSQLKTDGESFAESEWDKGDDGYNRNLTTDEINEMVFYALVG